MRNYYYYTITQMHDNKLYSQALRVDGCNNLLSILKAYKGIEYVHQCKTYKQAKELATYWNDIAKNDNRLLSPLELMNLKY